MVCLLSKENRMDIVSIRMRIYSVLSLFVLLKCANYSLEAILQMLRQLSENPDTDIAVILNRPIGSCRPNHKNICYPINYGYIQGVVAPDGEEQNAYILGVNYFLKEFTGRIIAIVQRFDDVEEKMGGSA